MSRLASTCILLIWRRRKSKRKKRKKKKHTHGLLLPCTWFRARLITRRWSLRLATLAEPSLQTAPCGPPQSPPLYRAWPGLPVSQKPCNPRGPLSFQYGFMEQKAGWPRQTLSRWVEMRLPHRNHSPLPGTPPCSWGLEGSLTRVWGGFYLRTQNAWSSAISGTLKSKVQIWRPFQWGQQ